MASQRSSLRLFRKLMLALSLSLLASVISLEIYFRVFGLRKLRPLGPGPVLGPAAGGGPVHRLPVLLGILPVEPLIFGRGSGPGDGRVAVAISGPPPEAPELGLA